MRPVAKVILLRRQLMGMDEHNLMKADIGFRMVPVLTLEDWKTCFALLSGDNRVDH